MDGQVQIDSEYVIEGVAYISTNLIYICNASVVACSHVIINIWDENFSGFAVLTRKSSRVSHTIVADFCLSDIHIKLYWSA